MIAALVSLFVLGSVSAFVPSPIPIQPLVIFIIQSGIAMPRMAP